MHDYFSWNDVGYVIETKYEWFNYQYNVTNRLMWLFVCNVCLLHTNKHRNLFVVSVILCCEYIYHLNRGQILDATIHSVFYIPIIYYWIHRKKSSENWVPQFPSDIFPLSSNKIQFSWLLLFITRVELKTQFNNIVLS